MSSLFGPVSLTRRHHSPLIAAAMLVLTLMVFETNGRASRGVNMGPREISATVTLVG